MADNLLNHNNLRTALAKIVPSHSTVKLKYIAAEHVSLKEHPAYNEAWLERQIKAKPATLRLGNIRITRSQLIQKKAGRLDLLAEDERNQFLFTIELMLGALDSSHVMRAIDYWLREKAREKREGWETVTVIIAEDVRESRYYNAVRFLSERMPLVVIEMHALRVGKQLTLSFTTLFDGRDQPTSEPLEAQDVEANAAYWSDKASPQSVETTNRLGAIIRKVDSSASINWTQRFVGIRVGNKAINFVLFVPKKQFVFVSARIAESEMWSSKLKKGGFEVIGGTPGRSVHFRVTKQMITRQKALLQKLFAACYEARVGDFDEV